MSNVSRFAFPQYTLGERVADGTIHAIGIVASIAAMIALLVIGIRADTAVMVATAAVIDVWFNYR